MTIIYTHHRGDAMVSPYSIRIPADVDVTVRTGTDGVPRVHVWSPSQEKLPLHVVQIDGARQERAVVARRLAAALEQVAEQEDLSVPEGYEIGGTAPLAWWRRTEPFASLNIIPGGGGLAAAAAAARQDAHDRQVWEIVDPVWRPGDGWLLGRVDVDTEEEAVDVLVRMGVSREFAERHLEQVRLDTEEGR